ncbi:uncharacterized protein JCM10292_001026 [Rhodotorula paludigena]|uniref:uncharacterized protein n=1 Tax=Rhodotorula paludigena TaxID=86838 RepID=UPI00317882A8
MTPLEQVLQLVSTVEEAAATALASLKQPRPLPTSPPSSSPSTSSSAPPPLADVRSDFVAHLQTLNKEVTAISLALKPPVSLDAVKGTLDKLVPILDKLRFVFDCLPRDGSVLAKKITWSAQECIEAFQSYLASTASTLSAPPASAKKERDSQLIATKAVWAVVEKAAALPQDELDAERASWRDTLQLLDDCLDEIKELSQEVEQGAEEPGEEEEDEDEDEDEDDFGSSRPLSAPERERATAAHLLLRLSRLLVNRLLTRTAPPSPPAALVAPAFLASAHPLISRLSALADDLAAALEPPQDELGEVADELGGVADELAAVIEKAVNGADDEAVTAAEKQWLAMWRKQRDTARAKLEAI